jgi:hypothetical protein
MEMGVNDVKAAISHSLHCDRQVFLFFETGVSVARIQRVIDGLDQVRRRFRSPWCEQGDFMTQGDQLLGQVMGHAFPWPIRGRRVWVADGSDHRYTRLHPTLLLWCV